LERIARHRQDYDGNCGLERMDDRPLSRKSEAGNSSGADSGIFLEVNEWQTDYNNFNRPKVPDAVAEPAAKRYYKAMEHAKHAPLAVLDDIGLRDSTDGFRGDLHAIINHRTTNAMPTIYTSNLPLIYDGKKEKFVQEPYDLIDVFGEQRLVDRMRDMCAVLHFNGESHRGRR
jgi:DNA replication protein DnaC